MSPTGLLQRLLPWLPSIVPEDRRGRPGAAMQAALVAAENEPDKAVPWLLAAACASLAGGEPLHALEILRDFSTGTAAELTRQAQALHVWAWAAAHNLYPGGSGAELPPGFVHSELLPQSTQPAENMDTLLLETLASYFATTLLPVRACLNDRNFCASGAAVGPMSDARRKLAVISGGANEMGMVSTAIWALIARADLAARAGEIDLALQELATLRAEAMTLGDAVSVAQTWLWEGDWFATPGSSPESLGLQLTDEGDPFRLERRDDARAANSYAQAQDTLKDLDVPRVRGALAIRQALLAGRSGNFETQKHHLRYAAVTFADAGDATGTWITQVHQWVATLQRGDLRSMRPLAPHEWSSPQGELHELIDWAQTRGSPSLAAGLGRLLQRFGEDRVRQGDLEAAELAFRLARPLLPLNGAIAYWVIPEVLAKLDARRGLNVRAIVRWLQILDRLPPPPDPATDLKGWSADVSQTAHLITVPTGVNGMGTIAIGLIEQGAARLRLLLERSGLDPVALPPPLRDPSVLQQQFLAEMQADPEAYRKRMSADSNVSFQRRMLEQVAAVAYEALKLSAPLANLLRARHAQRMGWDAQADSWFQAAYADASQLPIDARWLEVLVLYDWGRMDQALKAWHTLQANNGLPAALRATLALRAGDATTANALLQSLPQPQSDPPMGSTWQDWLALAETALAVQKAPDAAKYARRGIDDFEHWLGTLTRDAERLDACDDISVSVLYQVAVRAHLALAKEESTSVEVDRHRAAAFALAERHCGLLLPPGEAPTGIDDHIWRRWQVAAIDHATAYQRLLAALMAGPGAVSQPDVALPGQAELAAVVEAEHVLAGIDASLSEEEMAIIGHGQTASSGAEVDMVSELQKRLVPGSALLLLMIVGRELVGFCLTRAVLCGHAATLVQRLEGSLQRLLRACATGCTPLDIQPDAEMLAQELLFPFAAELSACDRLIVVAGGFLQVLPWHLLPWKGMPLGVTHVVSTLPAATLLLRDTVDRPLARGAALVVGDPAFDPAAHPGLRRLPGAALEAQVVAQLQEAMPPYVDTEARKDILRPLMSDRVLLHLAAHGRLDEVAPHASSIILTGWDELTVSNLIGLHLDTDLVVLSACDTGRGTATLGGDVVGLVRGLLAAGVRRCIVSLWPVDDAAACVAMVELHRNLKQGLAPAQALAKTQSEIRKLTTAALTTSYIDLGAAAHESIQRVRRGRIIRQLPPYPDSDTDVFEADDEDATRDGNSPSIWGAFVLVGC